jgi:hypothetical protein
LLLQLLVALLLLKLPWHCELLLPHLALQRPLLHVLLLLQLTCCAAEVAGSHMQRPGGAVG